MKNGVSGHEAIIKRINRLIKHKGLRYNRLMTELFEYKTSAATVKAAGDYLLRQIKESSGNILLLLSGGSSLNAVREAFSRLDKGTLKRIHIAQIDSLIVPETDEFSNWRQIKEALGDKLDQVASSTRIFNMGDDPEDMAIAYEMELDSLLSMADYAIGIYGVGMDGRVAGMLPSASPEDFTQFLDGRLVVDYKAADYQRVTTTESLIVRLDEAVVFASGLQKVRMVEKIDKNLPIHKSPIQMFKDAKRTTIFLGEKN